MDKEAILLRSERDPLYGLGKEGLLSTLQDRLRGRVDEAWIFGSLATDTMGPESDIDLILIRETNEAFQTRAFSFEDLLDIAPRMDILVYTKAEFKALTHEPDAGFWRSVTRTMKRIL
jgi:predicted nucleotidyltransferase